MRKAEAAEVNLDWISDQSFHRSRGLKHLFDADLDCWCISGYMVNTGKESDDFGHGSDFNHFHYDCDLKTDIISSCWNFS